MATWILRRYHAALFLILGVLLGSVCLFSRDSEFFATQPRYPHRIALTFDDGPHPAFTDRLLEVLRRERVAATFFVVGKQAERYPELVRDISRLGHQVANHTYNHLNLAKLSAFEVQQELDMAQSAVRIATGKDAYFFRPPGGRYNPQTLDLTSKLGYRMVLWTVFPQDHLAPSPEATYEHIMLSVRDGGVVLLHSGVESTLAVLPALIRDLRAKGYQFLTVAEMMEEGIDPRTLALWCPPKNSPPPSDTALQLTPVSPIPS